MTLTTILVLTISFVASLVRSTLGFGESLIAVPLFLRLLTRCSGRSIIGHVFNRHSANYHHSGSYENSFSKRQMAGVIRDTRYPVRPGNSPIWQ